jgi:hypothetical protein
MERVKKEESKRGEASLKKSLPPLLSKERGIKGVRLKLNKAGVLERRSYNDISRDNLCTGRDCDGF